jgi:hypothetical protein
MANLKDKIIERENKEQTKKEPKNSYFNKIGSKRKIEKDKQISVKVNSETYEKFAVICSKEGISRNSALNMLISHYVRDNEYLLEDKA